MTARRLKTAIEYGRNDEDQEVYQDQASSKESTKPTGEGFVSVESQKKRRFRRLFKNLRLRKKATNVSETLDTPEVIKNDKTGKFQKFLNFFKRKKSPKKIKGDARKTSIFARFLLCKDIKTQAIQETGNVPKENVVSVDEPCATDASLMNGIPVEHNVGDNENKTTNKSIGNSLKNYVSRKFLFKHLAEPLCDEDSELEKLFKKTKDVIPPRKLPSLVYTSAQGSLQQNKFVSFEIQNNDEFDPHEARCMTPMPKEPCNYLKKSPVSQRQMQDKQLKAAENRLRLQNEKLRPVSARRERVHKKKVDLKALEAERFKAQQDHMASKHVQSKVNLSAIKKEKAKKVKKQNAKLEAARSKKETKEIDDLVKREQNFVTLRENLKSSKQRREQKLEAKVEALQFKHEMVRMVQLKKKDAHDTNTRVKSQNGTTNDSGILVDRNIDSVTLTGNIDADILAELAYFQLAENQ